jgi:hypothetical protein
VTALAAGGCAPAAPASAVTGASHGFTLAEAEAAYGSYLTVSDTAAAQGDPTQGLADVAYAQWAVVHAQYTALASPGTPVPRYRYGHPVFYVPALTGYPQWFVVAVPRTAEVAGHPGTTVNTIMVFERRKPGLAWMLDGSAVLDQGLPVIARDRDGYATALATSDTGLLLRPEVVGPTQAAVVDDGPASAATAVVASGPLTTGLYAAQAAQARAAAAHGLQYQWLLMGATFPRFALRTAGGGALVLYAMYLNTTTQHPNAAKGPPIPVPAQFSPLLADPTELGLHGVVGNWTYEYAAIDPPLTAHNAKVDVIAAGGGPTYGHAW